MEVRTTSLPNPLSVGGTLQRWMRRGLWHLGTTARKQLRGVCLTSLAGVWIADYIGELCNLVADIEVVYCRKPYGIWDLGVCLINKMVVCIAWCRGRDFPSFQRKKRKGRLSSLTIFVALVRLSYRTLAWRLSDYLLQHGLLDFGEGGAMVTTPLRLVFVLVVVVRWSKGLV